MTNLNAWKQNRIRVLRTLFNENGAIAGSGPMSLLAGIGVLGLIFFYRTRCGPSERPDRLNASGGPVSPSSPTSDSTGPERGVRKGVYLLEN